MHSNQNLHWCLITCLALLLAGCSKAITDNQGRTVPAVGQTARLMDEKGWLCTSESVVAEMMTPPSNVIPPKFDAPPDRIAHWQQTMEVAFEQNMTRLKLEGKLIHVSPGSKVRIIGYYHGDARNIIPLAQEDHSATWVKVEALEGESSQKTGFTAADGVTE
jgi:hypothetical protein